MPRLVTQAVSEKPLVVLVGAASPLRSLFQSFFERHDFRVESIAPNSSEKNADTKQFANQAIYKVIVIDGWTADYPDYDQLFEICTLLHAQTESLFLIQEFESVTLTEKQYQRKQFRFQLETQLPQINIILGQDVLLAPTRWWWWLQASQKFDQQIVLDHQVTLYPMSKEVFTKLAQLFVVKPQQQLRVLIRGKVQTSSVVLAEIIRQYQRYHQYTLVPQQQQTIQLDLSVEEYFTVQHPPTEQLPTILQEFIQNLPSPKAVVHQTKLPEPGVLTSKTRPNTSRPKTTQPIPPAKPLLNTTTSPRVVAPPSSRATSHVETAPAVQVTIKPQLSQSIVTTTNQEPDTVDEKLTKLFATHRTEQKVTRLQVKATTNKKITTKNKKKSALFLSGLVLAGAGLGIFVLTLLFWLNQSLLQNSLLQQLKNPQEKVPGLSQLKSALQLQTDAYQVVVPEPFFDTAHEVISLVDEWQVVEENLTLLEKAQVDLFQSVLGNQVASQPLDDNKNGQNQPNSALSNPSADEAALTELNQLAYEELSRLYSRLTTQLTDDELDQKSQQILKDYISYLEVQRTNFITFQQLTPLFPHLLGQTEKRTYALLLQNEQELRPTGGFLQAVALITLDRGQLIDTQVFSVYDLDNRLAAVVTPPDDLKQVLGEERWYLRDSNWNPDFPTSAKQITWFLEQQLNKKVDGVIAINLGVIEDVLRATGPLELDQYNELLTDRNLAERMEFHSEVTLVESDQASDYTVTVLQELLAKLTQLPKDKSTDFLSVIGQQLKEKNLLISLADGNESATLSLLGWTGELVKPNCPAQFSATPCIVDSLAIFDSNVGVNKANFQLTRKDTHQVELSPTQANHTHTIEFENKAQSNAWPKGTYQSYVRLALPSSAKLQSIMINGQQLFAKDIILSRQGEFSIVGFLTNTPIKSTTDITISYSVPHSLDSGSSYTFFWQKQPGISQPLSKLDLILGTAFKPSLIAPQAEVLENTIQFSDIQPGHMFVGVTVK